MPAMKDSTSKKEVGDECHEGGGGGGCSGTRQKTNLHDQVVVVGFIYLGIVIEADGAVFDAIVSPGLTMSMLTFLSW